MCGDYESRSTFRQMQLGVGAEEESKLLESGVEEDRRWAGPLFFSDRSEE